MAPDQDQQQTQDQSQTASVSDDAFDAAFAEFSGGDNGESVTRSDTTGEAGAEERHGDAAVSADSGQQDDTPTADSSDPWATAPEPLKAAWQAAQSTIGDLTHKYNSANGRISALTKRLNDIAAAGSAAGTGDKKADAKAADEAAEEARGILDDPEFKTFREEYPEVAKPLEKVMQALQSKSDRLERELSTFSDERREKHYDQQEAALAAKHSDWREATASPQFTQWYQNAPPYMRAAVERHGDHIGDAEEVAHILETFKLQTGYGKTAQPPAKAGNAATPLSAKRQRQLESAAAPAGRGLGAASGAPDDFEAAFDHFTRKK